MSLDSCMGTELPNCGFQKSSGNNEHKNMCCNDPEGISTHGKSLRLQLAGCTRILPSPPAVGLLIVLHADAACLKLLSCLAISEILSKLPRKPPQSGKFRNVNAFWTAWAGAGSCLSPCLFYQSASAESISAASHFCCVQTFGRCLQRGLTGCYEAVGCHRVWSTHPCTHRETEHREVQTQTLRWSSEQFPFKSLVQYCEIK